FAAELPFEDRALVTIRSMKKDCAIGTRDSAASNHGVGRVPHNLRFVFQIERNQREIGVGKKQNAIVTHPARRIAVGDRNSFVPEQIPIAKKKVTSDIEYCNAVSFNAGTG